jgi:hypothetical protein
VLTVLPVIHRKPGKDGNLGTQEGPGIDGKPEMLGVPVMYVMYVMHVYKRHIGCMLIC